MSERSDERWLGRYVMKLAAVAVGAGLVVLTACGTAPVTVMESPPAHSVTAAANPAPTKTVIKYRTVVAAPPSTATPSTVPSTTAAAAPSPVAPQQPADQNVTDPWAVVSAYYGDIESGNYEQAYALIGYGTTTGQSYQQFAAGFDCTGSQAVTENWDSGDQVNFNLAAGDSCTGTTQYYTGTDTVQNGIIVAADVVQTG